MSIYAKFIDSAKKQQHCGRGEEGAACRATNMARGHTHSSASGPQTFLPSAVASTPISKQQYRRLVELGGANSQAHQPHQPSSGQRFQLNFDQQAQQQRRFNHSIQQTYSPHSSRVRSCVEINYVAQAGARQEPEGPPTGFHWFKAVDDPILLKWMQAMRFETELECLTALQARTLAIDEHSAGALSVRSSQVAIQEMRLEANFILDLIDHLIDSLPICHTSVERFSVEFSELWTRLTDQTNTTLNNDNRQRLAKTTASSSANYMNVAKQRPGNQLTIINCTPRKSAVANARTLRPLDKLAVQMRNVCFEFAQTLNDHREHQQQGCGSLANIDSAQLEANLRRIKEYYGKFVEISIRAECANIVRALDYDFSNSALNRLSSTASLRPVRPYESSCAQLPLKWALIALWQLTRDDAYICRTLTEKWQTTTGPSSTSGDDSTTTAAATMCENTRPAGVARVAKRLDYSTKYEDQIGTKANESTNSLRSDYEKLYQICQSNEDFRRRQEQLGRSPQRSQGALSSALKSKHERPVKQVSTIELLIEIIISQPNKHERVDVMNFIHSQANKLIDFEDLDQSVSAAIYTSNQYKVAALRILNHLCVNEQAIKTILKCLSTPPPTSGHCCPENKIIKSIFDCYQTAQEHIYQNETVFDPQAAARRRQLAAGSRRKRARQLQRAESGCSGGSDEYSDYGSRQTNSGRSSSQLGGEFDGDDFDDEDGDDAVVKEAIGLLIQLTTPFHRSNQGHDYYTLIGRFSIDSLVRYLTNIIKSTQSREMLLLTLSALANISFITTEPMKTHGTNRMILEILRASKARSKDLELRDQAVTILANAVETNLMDIVTNGGLTFLLSCLEVCPTRMANYKQQLKAKQLRNGSASSATDEAAEHDFDNVDHQSQHEYTEVMGDACSIGSAHSRGYHTIGEYKSRDRKPIILGSGDDVGEILDDMLECACDHQQAGQLMYTSTGISHCLSKLTTSESAALERIHQKTAVAFARMSADPITTKMVLEYGGVKQMIDLCKYDHRRNFSDTVLIACIAALRKISTVIGRDIFRNYNALDLIELDPKSALKVYGNPRDIVGSHELLASEV